MCQTEITLLQYIGRAWFWLRQLTLIITGDILYLKPGLHAYTCDWMFKANRPEPPECCQVDVCLTSLFATVLCFQNLDLTTNATYILLLTISCHIILIYVSRDWTHLPLHLLFHWNQHHDEQTRRRARQKHRKHKLDLQAGRATGRRHRRQRHTSLRSQYPPGMADNRRPRPHPREEKPWT